MEIFISWHGKRSHAVAVALRDWLPLIVNAFKPWLSSADIDKGARWRTELSTKLGSATAGIFCLTPSNLTAPWLILEAGAISKARETTYVCTLLVDLQPSDVKDPLAQFQATKTTKEDLHQLVKNLNKALSEHSMDDALVDRAFEKWWPDLDKDLKNLPSDETTLAPRRSDRELLEELVDIARAAKTDATTALLGRFLSHIGSFVALVLFTLALPFLVVGAVIWGRSLGGAAADGIWLIKMGATVLGPFSAVCGSIFQQPAKDSTLLEDEDVGWDSVAYKSGQRVLP